MYIGGMSNNYTIPVSNIGRVTRANTDNTVDSSSELKRTGRCETCERRKYVDGSNENDVSFKTPGVIKPEESFAKVSAHERQHVQNAIEKSSAPNAQLVRATVSYHMGVCPECGRTYVAGGTTNTEIKYMEKNPYEKNRKEFEKGGFLGANFDEAV